ncbi:MAG TPA: ATP-binding cassette domain-containing protein [Solirubrobacteraceae bacterium]|jgi:ABC-type multidrug transport system ATPase subunit|nr:ATP-binding cassette domain-containing protein [Solirubrobacteraceae bacterium]
MSLLQLEGVSRRYGGCLALDGVSLVLDPGELVTVLGQRRSGRSTLLRVAAGVETPDEGTVSFKGEPLTARSRVTGIEIGFCRTSFRRTAGPTVLDQLLMGQFARKVPEADALARASRALERVDAGELRRVCPADLKADEVVRVAIARALTAEPDLLVIDEPTIGVDLFQRDSILDLLRSLADGGMSVLASTGEGPGLLGADRKLTVDKGRLRGELTPELTPVDDISHWRQARRG